MPEPTRYLGKFRGTVVNNVDPMNMGRLQARVPDVLGDTPSTFAMPCLPVAGPRMGQYVMPPVGAGVWIEFEQGDPSYPIWTGCWYGSAAELPAEALAGLPAQPNIVLQTQGQRTIVLSDLPGGMGITLKTATGAAIVINDAGILITNGQGASISLSGPTVTVNDGALIVKP
ncbi:phage baseplate assembly protein V [Actinomadura sp. HBU206391]|uniref:phage baseplate assembly protein V n=1 Tax=Actinomadura sp. HBU206391 TaxID=2731692 RepID=UPI00164FC346|nr:phage baseplate assembly protein V [Actinomadura sp. HBU206391]MBC6463315.1 baseplate assembly protein [Actinomadura sp. HBU206391]